MRLTKLGQYAKGLAHYNPLEATALQDRLERIQWRLWHGDADEALRRARELAGDVAALTGSYPGLTRLVRATAGLATYIENNAGAITDYAARWDHGEIISTAFAESTVDLVVSRRFAKKQQMQWSKKAAHLLLQTRTRTLDGTLHDLFTTWYPAMPANDVQPAPLRSDANQVDGVAMPPNPRAMRGQIITKLPPIRRGMRLRSMRNRCHRIPDR
jgi:hypothetical protein